MPQTQSEKGGATPFSTHTGEIVIPMRHGSRWTLVSDYGLGGGTGHRQGYWCDDAAGGWGISRRSADAAIAQCVRPRTYPSRRAALEAVGAPY